MARRFEPPLNRAGESGSLAAALLERFRDGFLTIDELAELPPTRWLIDQVIPQRGLIWLAGKPGAGKTFCTIDLVAHIATGRGWQGHGREPARGVLYVAAEGVGGLAARFRAWMSAHDVSDIPNIRIFPHAVPLLDPQVTSALAKYTREQGARLLVFDTQSRVTVGMDENSSREAAEFVEQLDELRDASGAAILLVHHVGKSGTYRGSSVFDGAADAMLTVSRKSKNWLEIEQTKSKESEARTFKVKWRKVEAFGTMAILPKSQAADEESATEDRLSMRALAVLDFLASEHLAKHQTPLVSRGDCEPYAGSNTTTKRVLRELDEAGLIDVHPPVEGVRRYPAYSLSDLGKLRTGVIDQGEYDRLSAELQAEQEAAEQAAYELENL